MIPVHTNSFLKAAKDWDSLDVQSQLIQLQIYTINWVK